MSAHRITRACGHRETVHVRGLPCYRSWRLTRLRRGLCFDCRHHLDCFREAAHHAPASNLPDLVGDPGDLAHALIARSLHLLTLETLISAAKNSGADPESPFATLLRRCYDYLASVTDTSTWIRWRHVPFNNLLVDIALKLTSDNDQSPTNRV